MTLQPVNKKAFKHFTVKFVRRNFLSLLRQKERKKERRPPGSLLLLLKIPLD
jgi:hypothetical protein